MFKNTKRVLAVMLAFAVVAMSMFTGFVVSAADPVQTAEGTIDLLEFGDYLIEAGSTSKYWDTVLADEGETGDSWENAIIIDNAEEFVYLCKASGNDTIGKYYKVADGIAGFNLANNDLDINGTLADNIDAIKSAGKNHAGGTPGFQGHFDGNGVTVYGAWTNHNQVSNYAGLFGCTQGNVTIKNIHVNKAVFTAKNAAGGIVGYHYGDGTQVLTIENCSVVDSHLETQTNNFGVGVGAIVGYSANLSSWKEADKGVDGNNDGDMVDTIYVNGAVNISNCYVNLNEEHFISQNETGVQTDSTLRGLHGGVAGFINSNALAVSNCVVIGITPYGTTTDRTQNDIQHSGLATHFANIYTTENIATENVVIGGKDGWVGQTQNFTGRVFALADDKIKGAAALENMNLDWSVWMADADGYPELRSMHKAVKFADNGNGTHSEVCDCGFGGVSSKHIWENNECACGAKLDCAGRETIYWEGDETAISIGTGTKDDPYVIKTAAEFAWLIKNGKASNTVGKYFEIDEAIGTIVLQPKDFAEDIIGLKSAEEVQAYFEDDTYSFVQWPYVGWEGSCFAGNFDGNGVTVLGLYQVSTNNAGLFSTIDAGAVIKNIAIKNSYLTSSAGNYQVGGIAAATSTTADTKYDATYKVGAVWLENCVVANNYMYNSADSHDRSGVVLGASGDVVYMDNILVYGNKATYGDGKAMPVWSSGNNSTVVSDDFVAPEGLVLDTDTDDANVTRYRNKIRNSVIMGTTPYDPGQGVGSRFNDPNCFENVYSDAVASTFFANIGSDQIKTVTVGELAKLSLGDAWYNTTTYPELKAFHDADLPIVPNNDGTHGSVCSCDTVFTVPCTFVDGACSVCDAKMTCATKHTIYWNGAVATGFADTSAGTKDDPIILSSAEELAYLISSNTDVTKDKYFEISEDIGTIVLQPQDLASEIVALDSAAAVQAYFENDEYVFTEWVEKGWEQSCFAGNFDGNGVKIYGLYIVSDTNAALFPTVEAGASIHNVAVLNSYLYSLSTNANYQVGAIAAVTSNGHKESGRADEQGIVWFNGCTVGNCYMRNDAADANRSGVIFGVASNDSVAFDNCLVYGNDARHSVTKGDHSLEMALYAQALNSIVAPARVPEGLDVKTYEDVKAGTNLYYNVVRNTIAFGTDLMNTNAARSYRRNDPACFENNYTDGAAGTVAFTDAEWTYEETQIKSVTLETLNDNDLGDAWVKTEGYPELKAAHLTDVVDNGDGNHSVSCPCGAVKGEAEKHNFVNGVCDVCSAECAHVAGEAVEENRVDATCSANGSYDTVVYCTVCDTEISRETTVLTAEHTPGAVVEEKHVEGTCTTPATYDKVVYCEVCEEEISRETITTEIDPDNHHYIGGTCEYCGDTKPIVYGDVDSNGEVNGKDCSLLMQYINDWDVADKVDTVASDVNGDGIVNGKDYVLIIRYLNDWDVVLGK